LATVTVIRDDGATAVDGRLDGGSVFVEPAVVTDLLGWELKPEGLCRGDVCVPVLGRLAPAGDGRIDLVTAAALLRRPALVDADANAVVIGASADDRQRALEGKLLPEISLPDLDGVVHHVDEWAGKKKLLVAFASW
jgi:hypothetical protein